MRRGAGPARPRLGHAEVFAALSALSFLVARFLPVLELGIPCPFRSLTGLPCPTCGMTHAFVALAHGDAARALLASPAGALLAGLGWAFAVLDLVRLGLGLPLPRFGPAPARALARAAGALLLASWAFLLMRAGT